MTLPNQNKICIIIAYFGKPPVTVDLWLKSCAWNPSIDFLVYADTNRADVPDNVRWVCGSLSDMRAMAEEKLRMRIKLDAPYECCDFKAVYGTIFEDYLGGYDYWGYCDMDMIFGDLASFFDRYCLYQYDRFLSWGHLSLMRNTPENNERYKLPCTDGKGYKDAFTASGSTHFDEGEINSIYLAYGFPFFQPRLCADISALSKRMRLAGYFKDHKYQAFFWQNGKVWCAYADRYTVSRSWVVEMKEFAYIHFQKRQMQPPAFEASETNCFYICSDHFENKKSIAPPTLQEIQRINPYPGKIWELLEVFCYKLRNKLKE